MDRWTWRAVYENGKAINQGDINPATNREWSTDHLSYDSLKAIHLIPKDDGQFQVILAVKPGEKFIRFWRRYFSNNGSESSTCWVIGLERSGVTFYNFLRPDGTFVLSSDPEDSEFDVNSYALWPIEAEALAKEV